MIINVKKYLFVGVKDQQEEFFQQAQKLGVVQFIEPSNASSPELSAEIQRLAESMKILRGYPPVEQEEDGKDIYSTAQHIIELKKDHDALCEESRVLHQEISRVEIFGNFSVGDIEYIESAGGRKFQFFFSKKKEMVEHLDVPGLIYVGAAHGLDYFVAINSESRSYEGMVEMHISHSVGKLRELLEITYESIRSADQELKRLGCYQNQLYENYIGKINNNNLYNAQDYVQNALEDNVFAIEGWVANSDLLSLGSLIEKRQIHCEEILIEETDKVPTYLKNDGTNKIGEDLVRVYDVPSENDKDPSGWVLWAFALFFAIIIGDGGYGLVFLAFALFLRFKFPSAKGAGKRFIGLTTIIASSCILWGALTGSFFGISFGLDSPFRACSVLHKLVEKKASYHIENNDDVFKEWVVKYPKIADADNYYDFLAGGVVTQNGKKSFEIVDKFADTISMELALLIGAIHIITSLLRWIRRNWAGIGWIAFIIGAYLYFPSMLKATSLMHYAFGIDNGIAAEMGEHLLWGGMAVAILLAVVQRKLFGLLEIANVIQIFSDVLSYLRLYALALAGAKISQTCNDIGASIPIVPAVLVLVAGHSANIVLSIMSGVIHGLRLNFLEWYRYCFEGGGKILRPLSLIKLK